MLSISLWSACCLWPLFLDIHYVLIKYICIGHKRSFLKGINFVPFWVRNMKYSQPSSAIFFLLTYVYRRMGRGLDPCSSQIRYWLVDIIVNFMCILGGCSRVSTYCFHICFFLFVVFWFHNLWNAILVLKITLMLLYQAVNEDSLKRLNEYIDRLHSNQRVIPACLRFYVRPPIKRDNVHSGKRIFLKFSKIDTHKF